VCVASSQAECGFIPVRPLVRTSMGQLFIAQVNAWVAVSIFAAFSGAKLIAAVRDFLIQRQEQMGPIRQIYALTQLGNDQGLDPAESYKVARETVLDLLKRDAAAPGANSPQPTTPSPGSDGGLDAASIVTNLLDWKRGKDDPASSN
jgi:hypothetical protein